MLGLPDGVRACLFDLDGVLTRTATVHAAAWKEMFDEFLRQRAEATGEPFVPFDPVGDYERSVDGKPRVAGTRSFLEARGITLPEATVQGLSNRKNELVLRKLSEGRVEVFDGSVRYARLARDAGLRAAVVSSSANTRQVLDATGITDLFDVVMDGLVAEQRGLAGKPAPDTFLAAAADLGVRPPQAAVFEDALAGVQAGHAGGFALVVGVDRTGQAAALRDGGADVVVNDLADLLELA